MKCERTTCVPPGEIAADGYCDNCGHAPAANGRTTTAGTEPITTSPAGARAHADHVRRRPATGSAARLGAGSSIPPVPARDPASAVLTDPSVAEERRFCARAMRRAGRPAARRRAGPHRGVLPQLRRTRSRSRRSSRRATWSPASTRSSAASPTAGWAGSTSPATATSSDRWVVLKGLLNTRRRGRDGGRARRAPVPGRGRAPEHRQDPQLRRARRRRLHRHGVRRRHEPEGHARPAPATANGGRPDPLPVDAGDRLLLEILPALGHLHDLGLLFCDFKPDNVIQTGDSLKLIDLGGVYRMDDAVEPGLRHGRLPGARDRPRPGPTVAVRPVHRRPHARRAVHRLRRATRAPTVHACPRRTTCRCTPRFDSLYRVLERATAPDPDDRFQTAEEMADQLVGVLREVVAAQDGTAGHAGRARASPASSASRADAPDWRALPAPLVDTDDPAGGVPRVAIDATDPDELIGCSARRRNRRSRSQLRLARALSTTAASTTPPTCSTAIESADPWEWRVAGTADSRHWRGRATPPRARQFDAVYPHVARRAGAQARAGGRGGAGRRTRIPPRSGTRSSRAPTRLHRRPRSGSPAVGRGSATARARSPRSTASPDVERICRRAASPRPRHCSCRTRPRSRLGSSTCAPRGRSSIRCRSTACGTPSSARPSSRPHSLRFGRATCRRRARPCSGTRRPNDDLRFGLETTYRARARHAPDAARRIALIDQANRVRPRTLT